MSNTLKHTINAQRARLKDMLGNTLRTTVSASGVRIVRNIYGFRFQRRAALDQISKLERRIGSQKQTGSSTRVYYAIDAHTRDGRKITVAESLEGSRLADYVEEKTSGKIKANEVERFQLEDVRADSRQRLRTLKNNVCCVVDAEQQADLNNFTSQLLEIAAEA